MTSTALHPGNSECKRTGSCPVCGRSILAKRAGRKREYCSDKCRDAHRRRVNFQFCGHARYPHSAEPRNAKNSPVISNGCKADFAGRASVNKALRHRIIQVEILEVRTWREVVSSDGVQSRVAFLAAPLLRGAP